jgi:hypothetical protein
MLHSPRALSETSAVCPPFPSYWCVQNQWSTLFSSIVSRAATLEVLSTGVAGNYNGALQLVINSDFVDLLFVSS